MTIARHRLIDPEQTPYYHCVSRCVRRAFLCGQDRYSGKSFEHRRGWVEARLRRLTNIFAIDVCAYAVMSNHYHVVVHIDCKRLAGFTEEEIIERWRQLHRLPEGFDRPGYASRALLIDRWRQRLGSISWFMKSVNEQLARRANKEDGCKGRFWEGRFRSQALLDDAALLKCMVYVDLNPVRAKMAATPETSDYTSVKARIERKDDGLAAMQGDAFKAFSLPMRRSEYLALVDWTGRQFRSGKRGRIDPRAAPILRRLRDESHSWFEELRDLTRRYYRAIGSTTSLTAYREYLGQQRLKGLTA